MYTIVPGERLNGIQEVSGSIPLISTRKVPKSADFGTFFCIFCVTLENSEKVVHNAYIIACFLGCQNEGQNPDFYMIFWPLKIFYFINPFSES